MMSRRLHYAVAFAFGLAWMFVAGMLAESCVHPPSSLSATGQRDYDNARVVKALDLLRDTAVSAAAQQPPLISFATRQKIVAYHKAAVQTIAAAPGGWTAVVSAGLDGAVSTLSADEQRALAAYVGLLKALIQEMGP